MALSHSFFAIFLSSLVVLASATDYSYDSKPDTTKPYYNPKPEPYVNIPKPTNTYNPKPQPEPYVPKPTYESTPKYEPKVTIPKPVYAAKPKPEYGYNPKPKVYEPKVTIPEVYKPKPVYAAKPKPEYGYNPKPKVYEPKVTIPKVYKPKPKADYVPKPTYGYTPKQGKPYPIAIEGLVVCKSGSSYVPIQGAVVKITCKVVDQNGYETKKPVSCESGATNAKGYFYKKLDLSLGLEDVKLKIGECEAVLLTSPVESCNYPTDVNKGITGALLSSYKILNDKHLKLYSVGPFFYTPKPAAATPAGGY